MSQPEKVKAQDWKQQGSKDIKVIEGHVVRFPMSFERCERPKWVSGYCQKCNGELGDIVWLAHSTPFCKWEMDWAYGEFIYCDSCGIEAFRTEEKALKAIIAELKGPWVHIADRTRANRVRFILEERFRP